MIKPKKHKWQLVDKEIPGIYRCANCLMCKIKSKGLKTIYTGDEESYKGYEFWVYCTDCKIDTFKILTAKANS